MPEHLQFLKRAGMGATGEETFSFKEVQALCAR